MVEYASAGTFSVSKASVPLVKHRTFIRREINSSGVTETMLQLILIYARLLFSEKLVIWVNEQGRTFVNVYITAVE